MNQMFIVQIRMNKMFKCNKWTECSKDQPNKLNVQKPQISLKNCNSKNRLMTVKNGIKQRFTVPLKTKQPKHNHTGVLIATIFGRKKVPVLIQRNYIYWDIYDSDDGWVEALLISIGHQKCL